MRESRGTWAQAALVACLEHLRVSAAPQAGSVVVHDSWPDGPSALCVVYSIARFDGRLGLRRTSRDIASGDLYDGHGAAASDGAVPDPIAFGRDVADYDLAEPLGGAAEQLRRERAGTGGTGDARGPDGIAWWGTLRSRLPVKGERLSLAPEVN